MDDEELNAVIDALQIGDMNDFMRQYTHADDYTLIVNLAAFMEEILERLIRERLLVGKATDELLSRMRPLSSLSAKISIARALGLISDSQYSDLSILRAIRNDFAHSWKKSSLSVHEAKILKLSEMRPAEYISDPIRAIFISTFFTMFGYFFKLQFELATREGRLKDVSGGIAP